MFNLAASATLVQTSITPDWLDAGTLINKFVEWLGPWAIIGVMLVIFAETGLLVGFFLPGDSLLFTLGMFVGTGAVPVPIWVAAPAVFLAAIAGNGSGYLIGSKVGPKIFERHGGKAVTLAQFVPIIRTFTPVMAGVGKMHYRHFAIFNLIGAFFWAFCITLLGFWLGNFTWVRENIEHMILVIVFISLLPMIIKGLQSYLASRKAQS